MNYINRLLSTKDWFSKNLGWKIFSLLGAFLFWFMVVNISNPMETWSYKIPISFEKMDVLTEQNLVIKNFQNYENREITIKVRGKRLSLDKLDKLQNEIQAVANFSVIYNMSLTKPVQIPIDISLPESLVRSREDTFDIIDRNPVYLEVSLEQIVEEEKQIKAIVRGEPAEGYVALTPEVFPETVNLVGPNSALSSINSVSVYVDIEGVYEDVSVYAPLVFLDSNEKEVEGISADVQEALVSIKINKYKKVPVYGTYENVPAEGYLVTDISWSPNELEIVGSDASVNSFTEINLPPIDVSGRISNVTRTFDIRTLDLLPANVSIRNGTPNEVAVTIRIERMVQRPVTVESNVITTTGTLLSDASYTILSTEVSAIVTGTEESIEQFDELSLIFSIDVTGYEAGEHNIPVNISLPEGIRLLNEPPTVQVLIESQADGQEESNLLDESN